MYTIVMKGAQKYSDGEVALEYPGETVERRLTFDPIDSRCF